MAPVNSIINSYLNNSHFTHEWWECDELQVAVITDYMNYFHFRKLINSRTIGKL